MKKGTMILGLALIGGLVTACVAGSPATTRTIHVDMPVSLRVDDLPWAMAVDALQKEGYDIETSDFSDVDPNTVVAMEQGGLDITSISSQIGWSAVDKGLPLITFVDRSATPFALVVGNEIQTCAQLDGKPVAIPGISTVTGAMLQVYLDRHCPGTEPDFLMIKKADSRMAALLSDEATAALLFLDDLLYLEHEQPGMYHSLIVFAEEFPGLEVNSYVVLRDFAEQYPELVKDLIRNMLTARRELQDADALQEAIVKYLGHEPDVARQMAETYVQWSIWDAKGEYSLETVQVSIDFLQEYGDLAAGLDAADVADLSSYEAVLDEMSRQ